MQTRKCTNYLCMTDICNTFAVSNQSKGLVMNNPHVLSPYTLEELSARAMVSEAQIKTGNTYSHEAVMNAIRKHAAHIA